jgi:hypothetical protein
MASPLDYFFQYYSLHREKKWFCFQRARVDGRASGEKISTLTLGFLYSVDDDDDDDYDDAGMVNVGRKADGVRHLFLDTVFGFILRYIEASGAVAVVIVVILSSI